MATQSCEKLSPQAGSRASTAEGASNLQQIGCGGSGIRQRKWHSLSDLSCESAGCLVGIAAFEVGNYVCRRCARGIRSSTTRVAVPCGMFSRDGPRLSRKHKKEPPSKEQSWQILWTKKAQVDGPRILPGGRAIDPARNSQD